MNGLSAYLQPAFFVDSDHPDIIAFARDTVGEAQTDLFLTGDPQVVSI